MPLLRDPTQLRVDADGCVLTIGNFDGLHLGHRSLLAIARTPGLPIVVMTFDPHPLAILRPEQAPAQLTTTTEKAALLQNAGVDHVVALPTDRAMLSLTAEAFIDQTIRPLSPRLIVEGPTFRFGRGAKGNADTLVQALGDQCQVRVAEEARTESGLAINSTAVRTALQEGDVELASEMLGRPYRLTGTVGYGEGRGGPLGFPTANLDRVPQLIPAHGVYAAIAQTAAGGWHPAAVNVGPQPTFDGQEARIEAHLLDFGGDLREQPWGLYFLQRLRGQVRFAGVDELRAQLDQDKAATRAAVERDAGVPEEARIAL